EGDAALAGLEANGDIARLARVLDRVVEQVDDGLREGGGVEADAGVGLGERALYMKSGALEVLAMLLHDPGDHGREVAMLEVVGQDAALDAGEGQDLVHQTGEALALANDHAVEIAALGLADFGAAHQRLA